MSEEGLPNTSFSTTLILHFFNILMRAKIELNLNEEAEPMEPTEDNTVSDPLSRRWLGATAGLQTRGKATPKNASLGRKLQASTQVHISLSCVLPHSTFQSRIQRPKHARLRPSGASVSVCFLQTAVSNAPSKLSLVFVLCGRLHPI